MLSLAAVLVASCGVAAFVWHKNLITLEDALAVRADDVSVSSQTLRQVSAGPEHRDFTDALPALPNLPELLAWSRQACSRAGIRIQVVQVSERPSSSQAFYRSALHLSLTGDYVRLKEAVAEIFAHFPNATLDQLTLRRRPGGTELDAVLKLTVWGKALKCNPSLVPR